MAVKIDFDLGEIEKYINESKRIFKDLANIFVDTVAEELLSQAQYNLREDPETKAFDTGGLAERSGTIIPSNGSGTATVGWGGEGSDYVLAIEYGLPPRTVKPPVVPLIAWARRVGIPNPDQVAWAIRQKIWEKGTPEKPFFSKAVEQIRGRVKEIWEEVVLAYG